MINNGEPWVLDDYAPGGPINICSQADWSGDIATVWTLKDEFREIALLIAEAPATAAELERVREQNKCMLAVLKAFSGSVIYRCADGNTYALGELHRAEAMARIIIERAEKA